MYVTYDLSSSAKVRLFPLKISQLFLLLFVISSSLFSQSTKSFNGFVRDSLNGEAIPFSTVFIKELKKGATANEKGVFVINGVPVEKDLTLLVSCVGYNTLQRKLHIKRNEPTNEIIYLSPTALMTKQIEKIGEWKREKNAPDLGLQRLTIKNLEALPQGVETDVFRSLQSLPGVHSTGDVSAKYYVRGGSGNQNLVLLDGTTIYNPFHALGMFSVIDPEIINVVEFYKGGFTSDYGGRLSSVLKVSTKKGNDTRYASKFSASLLTVKALAEGPLPFGSFLISGRKSISTAILKKFITNNDLPFDFYDFSFRFNFDNRTSVIAPRFTIFGFFSGDRLSNNDPRKDDVKWSNNVVSLRWDQVYNGAFFSDFNVYFSEFIGEVIPNLSLTRPKKNTLFDGSLKYNFNYIFENNHEFSVGVHVLTVKSDLDFITNTGFHSSYSGNSGNVSLYTKYKLMYNNTLGIDFGGRLNLIGLIPGGSGYFEPRINFNWRLIPELAIKASYGHYQQELTTVSDESEIISLFEPWIIIPDYLQPARAHQYSLGCSIDLNESVSLEPEIYYIKMSNIPSINYKKQYPDEHDLVNGHGESYGLESVLKYQSDDFILSLSYSLSYAYKTVENWRYYPKYDSRHSGTITIEYMLGNDWNCSLMWLYNSGYPFTKMTAYYDKQDVSQFYSAWLPYIEQSPYAILGDRNTGRLPDYHRLDFSISKKFDLNYCKLDLDFSILNIYDRKNIFYFNRKTGERVNMLPILPTASLKVEL